MYRGIETSVVLYFKTLSPNQSQKLGLKFGSACYLQVCHLENMNKFVQIVPFVKWNL